LEWEKARALVQRSLPVRHVINALTMAVIIFGSCLAISYVLIPLTMAFLILGSDPRPPACSTEILGKIPNLAGYDFEISDTVCKALAADEAVTIFVSRYGETKKTALFKYDPGALELPTITLTAPDTVTISVRRVSSIFFRKSGWDDMTVRYDLGAVAYPEQAPGWIRRRLAYRLCLAFRNHSTPDWDECSPYASDRHLYRPG
jgi:hypothetical protein